ncbi:small-subunit processome [Thamnocephalis sphaerospora]|uniref:U3 small nucleolar RNA-associated protein 11 n=1 Tax=Thamnocephalis sphaerospora TaxID=78915 RepID=A0A4P9XVM2_9FUNG|nr:small-subunit processome [Thamnocephalis sphaerospora]|eukprot:RKP10308.1 small-subunit processome [Thamnocephalis sphaerospora]
MSSLRNAVRQRTHRERGQLPGRERLGQLEKHKDYVKRAKDYNFKEKRLSALRQKAHFRNPDEFYFKMINSQTKNGVHITERAKSLPDDMRKLLKSQDLNYVGYARSIDKKKIERLQGDLQFIGVADEEDEEDADEEMLLDGGASNAGPVKPTHTLFVDSEEQARKLDVAKHFDTLPELVQRRFNRPTIDQLKTQEIIGPDGAALEKLRKQRSRKYRELEARLDRDTKLADVEREIVIQKSLMSKGRRKKIGTDKHGLPVYKWKADRKK